MREVQVSNLLKRLNRDIAASLGLLTAIPTWQHSDIRTATAGVWCWPLLGALVGATAGLTGILAVETGLAEEVSALIVVSTAILLTGGLHEDGLADAADGVLGGTSKDSRVAIMQDSRIGTFGVLAVIIVVLFRWMAVAEVVARWQIMAHMAAAGALSRFIMVVAMHLIPSTENSQLAKQAGKPSATAVLASAGIALAIVIIAVRSDTWIVVTLGVAAPAIVLLLAWRRVDGLNGDILGASQQASETAVLVGLSAAQ